ncbi:MAG: tryptophan--tRNA ligase [Clostridia bacterium]|nr:tryptophan--tRNA ligase [Clostridia bacterium]MCL6520934.1 tryptophan--tRNA ligase [Bacillota bacterium]
MKRAFSGVQPSGNIHIGNYLGAVRQFVQLQDVYEGIYCVVDLHAITVPQEPAELRRQIREVAAFYLAAGLDPARSTLFVQSDVPAHPELAWILNCFATFGELSRMTQFKDKARKSSQESVSAGLFNYPVLMAADILLYQADVVPVGEDQKQHVELTRDLAERVNRRLGPLFRVPEPLIPQLGARIMGLDNPQAKMSKSAESPWNYISFGDDPDLIRRKIARAVTDSGREVVYDPEAKPAIANLLTIFSGFTGRPVEELEREYRDTGYARFKADLAEAVIAGMEPIRRRLAEMEAEPGYLEEVLRQGAERAAAIAESTVRQVKEALGLGLGRA